VIQLYGHAPLYAVSDLQLCTKKILW